MNTAFTMQSQSLNVKKRALSVLVSVLFRKSTEQCRGFFGHGEGQP